MGQALIEAIEQTDGVKTMAVFHKIVKLVKNGILMIIYIYVKVSV
jgi:hypothetical protein